MGTSTDCTAAMMCRTGPRSASQAGACRMAPCDQKEREGWDDECAGCCSARLSRSPAEYKQQG